MRAPLLASGLLLVCSAAGVAQGPVRPPTVKPPATADPSAPPAKDPGKENSSAIEDPLKEPDFLAPADASQLRGADDPNGGVQAPDYTGPAILSRGFALTRPVTATNDRFQPYIGVNFSYDTGMAGPYVQNGNVPQLAMSGAEFNWGIKGRHYRRKDIFELDYTGHYYAYSGNNQYSGQEQTLSFGYTRQLSPRFRLSVRETGGLYSNTYAVLNSTSIADTSLASSTLVVAPNTEAFDDRTYYSTTQVSLMWMKTPRLSFSIQGAGFLVRRDSQFLADTNGGQANFDVNYRLTKRQTVGAYYSHSIYSFLKQFGNTDADSAGMVYSIALSRNMDLSLRGGITRLENQTLAVVTPNPLVQAILGITSGVEKQYAKDYAPDVTITFTRRLRRSSIGAAFIKGITPGNGLVLTSARESESVFYDLPTFRHYAMQVGLGRDVLSGYVNSPGSYSSYFGRASISHPMSRSLTAILNYDYRQFGFSFNGFHQKENRVTVGVRYSPSERPLNIW